MNQSIQKLFNDFLNKIGMAEMKMLGNIPRDSAMNYLFYLYNQYYGDYPTGDIYNLLEEKIFLKEVA